MKIAVKLKSNTGTILAQTVADADHIGGQSAFPGSFTLTYNWSAYGLYDSGTTPTTWELTASSGGYLDENVGITFPTISDSGYGNWRLDHLTEAGFDAGQIETGDVVTQAISGSFVARAFGMTMPLSVQGNCTTYTPTTVTGETPSSPVPGAVTITWTTSQPATSQVEYGPTTSYGSTTTTDSTLVTSHTVVVTGLTPGVTYHFRPLSQTSGGPVVAGADIVVDIPLFFSPSPVGADLSADAGTMSLRWLDDRKKWSNERLVSLGATGDTFPTARICRLGLYRTRQWELVCSDPTVVCIVGVEEDAEVFR